MAKSFTNSSNWASTTPSLSTRSLFLTITPTPRTMAARLSILRAISAHGPVDHFRCLKHHPTAPQPNAFHTIVSTKESAERLIKSSPFSVDGEGRTRAAYVDEIGIGQQNDGEGEEAFTVEVRHSYHAPEVAVKSSPLYGGWKSALGKNGVATNPITVGLKERVPSSIAKEGIVDWSRDSPRERRAWFTGEGGSETTPWRIQRRMREEGLPRRAASWAMRRQRPVEKEEEVWEDEEMIAQEDEQSPFDGFDGGSKPRRERQTMDPEMQRALHQVRDSFGPSSETIERTAQEAEAERIEAERIASIRAAAMERTRQRMGQSFTGRLAQTLEEAVMDAAAEQQAEQRSAQQAEKQTPTPQEVADLEKARKAMKEKKARYAAWAKGKEESGQSLKHKSRTEKWKMFWDEVERARTRDA